VLCAASSDATVAVSIFIAAVAAWTTTNLGCALYVPDKDARATFALRILAIAGALMALSPFIPGVAALILAILLGMHAIFAAAMGMTNLLRSA
jgi:hypothetical protein